MQSLQTLINKVKFYVSYLDELQDIRIVGLILFGVVVLLVSWSGVKAIDANYKLQRQISELRQENNVDNLSNQNMKLQNQYFKSQQYLELSARQNFGLAKPGETLVVIPKNVALSHTTDTGSSADDEALSSTKNLPKYQQNFRAWVDFFLHRQHVGDATSD